VEILRFFSVSQAASQAELVCYVESCLSENRPGFGALVEKLKILRRAEIAEHCEIPKKIILFLKVVQSAEPIEPITLSR